MKCSGRTVAAHGAGFTLKFNPCRRQPVFAGFTAFSTCFNEQNWLEEGVQRKTQMVNISTYLCLIKCLDIFLNIIIEVICTLRWSKQGPLVSLFSQEDLPHGDYKMDQFSPRDRSLKILLTMNDYAKRGG